ncbi:MAG: molybdopterin-binding protein, partial [Casimicrobiaceae bacterium]
MGIGVLVIGDEILTGKRADKHLAHAIETLGKRGLDIDFAHYLGDDRGRLTAVLKDTFSRNELVFSFGGIGATPDDCTRQAAAAALGVELVPHP